MVAKWICVTLTAMPLLLATGCADSTSGPDGQEHCTFPLQEGNSWEYEYRTLWFTAADGRVAVIDTVTAEYWLQVAQRETLESSICCYELVESALYDSTDYYEASGYYDDDETGLYLYAYESPFGVGVGVTPKLPPGVRVLVGGQEYSRVRAALSRCAGLLASPARSDSLVFEDPPIQCLAYPLTVGEEWVYRQPGDPWAISKSVVGLTDVDVPAGIFNCYAIRWLIDFSEPHPEWDDDIEWVDYFSDSGLVRRTIAYHDVIVTSPDSPEPIDTLDLWEEAVLTRVHVD